MGRFFSLPTEPGLDKSFPNSDFPQNNDDFARFVPSRGGNQKNPAQTAQIWEKKEKKKTPPGGLEPPTCRLTAERATYCAIEAGLKIRGITEGIYAGWRGKVEGKNENPLQTFPTLPNIHQTGPNFGDRLRLRSPTDPAKRVKKKRLRRDSNTRLRREMISNHPQ